MFENLGLESKYKCEHPILLRSVSSGVGKPKPVSKLGDGFKFYDVDGDLPEYRPRKLHYEFDDYVSFPALVRCGKCEACRKFQSDEWFVRCCHHLSANGDLYPLFVTFTFSPEGWQYVKENCDLFPDGDGKLDYTEVYKFIFPKMKKRLRAERGSNLQFDYFLVSEFGEAKGRFHLHTIFYFRNTQALSFAAAAFCREYPFLRHFVINKKAKVRRLQTDLEVFLQHHIERNFTFSEGVKRDFIPHSRFNEYGKRSTYYTNQFGYVTAFSTQSFGMFKYISNYTNKCLKDGKTTFRRFSPGLGFAWAFQNLATVLLGVSKSLPLGLNQDGKHYQYFIPRSYFRKVCPRSHFINYCVGEGKQKALNFAYQHFLKGLNHKSLFDGFNSLSNNFQKFSKKCTKLLSEMLPHPKDWLSSLPPLSISHLLSFPDWSLALV